ncbi:type 1 glutamine amidotransferase [Planotetraspora sp. A-T 1434]|uniref:type 1 glutamine amidotransferase n=1 Tax=Planotetraspora sp. A-T 1434 TaxID=2979219 RepID=UPI0021C0587C|nr:type 1 glutamine amidotransferase [Planotetraspora sp. A-T 1434]MCT9930046.1 type 1 glutamine amidotransferase [Planotetraspora sp. A-T 1434]
MRERVIVIEHEAEAGLGFFKGWLEDAGAGCEVVRPYKGDAVPDSADGGLLVLGGEASAWDDEGYGWLPATRALLARAVEEGVPTLGICLGAQLMTIACGGTVERGAAGLEIGACAVEPLPEAADDLLFSALPTSSPYRAVQYHYDAMTELPPGAVRLATGGQYPNQAYRLGERAWAVQFHPEATAGIFISWTSGSRLAPDRIDELNTQVKDAEPELVETWRPLAEAFAAAVRERHAGSSPERAPNMP